MMATATQRPQVPALLLAMAAAAATAGCHQSGHQARAGDPESATPGSAADEGAADDGAARDRAAAPGGPTENAQPRETDMSTDDCARALRAIETRDFRDWQGLPPGCDWQPLAGPLPAESQELPFRNLGAQRLRTPFVQIELAGYKYPRLSLRGGQVVLFDAREPALAGDSGALAAALGAPAARLDWHYGTFPLASGELVYPDRGIAIFVNPETDKVLHIALYAPTTLARYQAELRLDLEKKLRPLKKSR